MEIIGIFFLQNGLKRDSTFCTKSIFGNIAVHRGYHTEIWHGLLISLGLDDRLWDDLKF
jgi:hypothetical protein